MTKKSKQAVHKTVDRVKKAEKIIKGKGGYFGETLGRAIGERVGLGNVGAKVGNWVGDKTFGFVKKLITGEGTYNYKAVDNLDFNGKSVPSMHSTETGVRVRNKEFITDVVSSTLFTNTVYPINPGLPGTFPWLSAFATDYEEYIIHGLAFVYVSTSASALNSTNTALGTVIMAFEDNPLNPSFISKVQMESQGRSSSGSPDKNMACGMECDPKQSTPRVKYIRYGSLASGLDISEYDSADFNMATIGMQATTTIGELHVTYDVEFLKPRLTGTAVGTSLPCDRFRWSTQSVITNGYFGGGNNNPTSTGMIGGILTGGFKYTFPVAISSGNYLVLYYNKANSTGSIQAPTITLANAVPGNLGNMSVAPFVGPMYTSLATGSAYNSSSSTGAFAQSGSDLVGLMAPSYGATGSTQIEAIVITVVAPGSNQASLTFSAGVLPTGGTTWGELLVLPYPSYNVQTRKPVTDNETLISLAEDLGVEPYEVDDYEKWFWSMRRIFGSAPTFEEACKWCNYYRKTPEKPQELFTLIQEEKTDEPVSLFDKIRQALTNCDMSTSSLSKALEASPFDILETLLKMATLDAVKNIATSGDAIWSIRFT